MTLSEKDPVEIITVTFDFSAMAQSLTTAVLSVSSLRGREDATPMDLLSGDLAISGALVMQRFTGGQDGTTYSLRCVANDADGEVHVLTAALPVKVASPL